MRTRALLLSLAFTVVGCLVDADLSGTGYLCDTAEDCAPGLLCEAGRCAQAVTDAGLEPDAGTVQAPNEVVRLRHPTIGNELLTLDPARVAEALDAGYVSHGVVFTASSTPSDALIPIYELRHELEGDDLFTGSRSESDSAENEFGYVLRDIAFYAAPPSTPNLTRVHRMQRLSIHRYAVGETEREALIAAGWNYEHVLFRVETR